MAGAIAELEPSLLSAFRKGSREESNHLLPLAKNPNTLRTGVKNRTISRAGHAGSFSSSSANLLHLSARNGWLDMMRDLVTNYGLDALSCDDEGHTCLHYALSGDSCTMDIVKYLIDCAGCAPLDLVYSDDDNGLTPLHYAAGNGYIDILKYLINDCGCDPMLTADDGARTALHYAVRHIDVAKYLVTKCDCDPFARAKDGMTPLHYTAQYGSLDVMKYLINDCGCDPMAISNDGKAPLHFAVHNESTDILKYLITELNCDPMSVDGSGQTALHLAMEYPGKFLRSIEYLLSTGKCDPFAKDKDGVTPMQKAKECWYNKLIIPIFRKFGQIKTSHPVDSYVSVLLLGNPGAGKSSLAQVIIDTTTGFSVLGQFRTVKGVELCTAGIVPTKLQHSQLGNIILYDLAGHSEYYTSHTAVIENLLKGSGAVFVLVVNIFEEEALKHLQQWLTVVRNEAHKALGKCHVIVVASHKDEMNDAVARKRREEELQQIIAQRCGNDVSFTCLDCRKLGGGSVNSFFSELSIACQSIRSESGKNLTLYCHMMYGLLEERKQNVITLSDLRATAKYSDHYILPVKKEEFFETLFLLHSTGLICLLQSRDEVWVVFNKQILLAEVNGILFAPKTFKQHRAGIASNTGIMTVSALSELFPNYDPDMLICFLKNMALCQEIDTHFLSTLTNLQSVGDSNDGGRLLFFPTLLDIPRPSEMASQVYQFGWCLQCTQEHDFFPSRYFHVLLLHLAYKYTLPQQTDKLNRRCTFWRNGLHWFDGNGIGTLVETVDESQCVLVLMSSEEDCRENMVSLRKEVIGEVLSTYKKLCPSLKVEELLIDPTEELVYPMNKPTAERAVYSVQDIIKFAMEKKRYIVTATGNRQIELKRLISDESLEACDCSILSLLGGRDLKELTDDIIPCTVTAADTADSSIDQHILNIKSLDDVTEALSSNYFASSNWYQLGLQLGLYDPTLRDIEEKCRGDPHKCLLECLVAWLKSKDKVTEKGGPSWLTLATALDTIGEHTVANKIRRV